jgi:TetR/AcrR family transcriptional regulator, transcriptional repressor for nem operon
MHPTKDLLLTTGLRMLLERGYHNTGIQDVLVATKVPKGSFYHHFSNKEDFALGIIERYVNRTLARLDALLADESLSPLGRLRRFFEEARDGYVAEGHHGCLLGALGQELAGVNETIRMTIERCLKTVAGRIAGGLEEACRVGELPPDVDTVGMADVLVDCWEGAALRMRLVKSAAPLDAVLNFYFGAVAV